MIQMLEKNTLLQCYPLKSDDLLFNAYNVKNATPVSKSSIPYLYLKNKTYIF